jgi:hypothetical protein
MHCRKISTITLDKNQIHPKMPVRAVVPELTNKQRACYNNHTTVSGLSVARIQANYLIHHIYNTKRIPHHNPVATISHKYYFMSDMDIRGEEAFLGALI